MTATNLSQASDHPARLLDSEAVRLLGVSTSERTDAKADGYKDAADWLRRYQREHGVTLAALDDATLQDLRDAYATLHTPSGHLRTPVPTEAVRALTRAVEALLGLDGE